MRAIEDKKTKEFINEIVILSKKFGLSLGHEDIGGNFEIHQYDERKMEWLKNAVIGLDSDYAVYRQVPSK